MIDDDSGVARGEVPHESGKVEDVAVKFGANGHLSTSGRRMLLANMGSILTAGTDTSVLAHTSAAAFAASPDSARIRPYSTGSPASSLVVAHQLADSGVDLVADWADLGWALAGRVRQLPVEVALAGGRSGRCRRSPW